ncbi:MAG: hypothetical protein ACYCU5_12890 [Actinomycetes bacterium]
MNTPVLRRPGETAETFCRSLITQISRSAALLSKLICGSVVKRR